MQHWTWSVLEWVTNYTEMNSDTPFHVPQQDTQCLTWTFSTVKFLDKEMQYPDDGPNSNIT
jgi:hypothetical protein